MIPLMKTITLGLLVMVLLAAAQTAPISGTWEFTFQTEAGVRHGTFVLNEPDGTTITGLMDNTTELNGTYSDAVLTLEFKFFSPDAGFSDTAKLTAKHEGDQLTGTWQFAEYSGTFEGKRKSETP